MVCAHYFRRRMLDASREKKPLGETEKIMFMNPKFSYPKICRVSSGLIRVAQEREDVVNQDGCETKCFMKPEPHTVMRIIDKTKDQHKTRHDIKTTQTIVNGSSALLCSALIRHDTIPCLKLTSPDIRRRRTTSSGLLCS